MGMGSEIFFWGMRVDRGVGFGGWQGGSRRLGLGVAD